MTKRITLLATLVATLLVSACDQQPSVTTGTAKFGILYGGQLQQRTEVPFELDTTRQVQAFRVELAHPARQPLEVQWEVTKPGTRARKRSTHLGQAMIASGQAELEQLLPFEPGDPLGIWNLRVILTREDGSKTVLVDRPFHVYDAAARKRRLEMLDAEK